MNKVLHQLLFTVFLLSAFPGLGGTEEKNDRVKVPIVTPALVAPDTDAEFMQVTNLVADERTDARKAFSTLDAQSQYVEGDLTYDDLVTLPVGIRKKIGENTIEMAVAKAVFLSEKAELTVYIRMTIPVADVNTGTTERVLYFGADQVGITRNGGLTGDFRAVLLGDFVLPFRNYSIILRGGGGLAANGQVAGELTYAEFTCGSGFEEARLVADVVFPREVLIPLDKTQNYEVIPNGRVTGHFDFMSDKGLHNVLISVSASSAFAIKGVDRFAFELQNLSIDLSDSLNPSNFVSAIDFPHTASPSWRGVYIENFTVVLPPEFRKKGSEERIAIYAHNVMVDRLGFSGKIGVGSPGNLPLTLEEGDASGWRFAVDRVELDIFGNKLRGGRFAGRIALPVSSEDNQALAYEGAIEPGGNYRLAISNLEQVDFSFMRAKAVISPGSRVVLDVINGRFKPKAVLHGSMGIYANLNDTQANTVSENGDNILAFKGITFENLVLQTDAPRLTFGKIGYEQSGKMALFPVVIESFSLLQTASPEQNRIEVGIGVSVNLMNNNSGKGFSGSTMVTFEAEENPDGRWKFKGLKKPIDIFSSEYFCLFAQWQHSTVR